MPAHPQRQTAPPETIDDDPFVTAVMTERLVGITPDSPVSTALRLMAGTGVRHLPVLDGQRCVGLVVEADLVRCLAQVGSLASGVSLLVGELARPVHPLPVTARRSDAARCMQPDAADAVLVVDRDRVLGIVTATDLIRSLAGARAGAGAASPDVPGEGR